MKVWTVVIFSVSSQAETTKDSIVVSNSSDLETQYIPRTCAQFVRCHEFHGGSNYRQLNCLFNSFLTVTPKKRSTPWLPTLCNGWILSIKGQYCGKIYTSWRHHAHSLGLLYSYLSNRMIAPVPGPHFTNMGSFKSKHGYLITSIIKCEMKLLINSQTSTVQPLKFGNGYVISSHTLLGMWWLLHAGIKLKPYMWKRPLEAPGLNLNRTQQIDSYVNNTGRITHRC